MAKVIRYTIQPAILRQLENGRMLDCELSVKISTTVHAIRASAMALLRKKQIKRYRSAKTMGYEYELWTESTSKT